MGINEIRSGIMNASDVYSSQKLSHKECYRRILENKLEEKDKVLENDENSKPIVTGGRTYTQKEWNEMLESYDATLEDLREQMRAEHKRQYEEMLRKKAEDAVIDEKKLQQEEFEEEIYEEKVAEKIEQEE